MVVVGRQGGDMGSFGEEHMRNFVMNSLIVLYHCKFINPG